MTAFAGLVENNAHVSSRDAIAHCSNLLIPYGQDHNATLKIENVVFLSACTWFRKEDRADRQPLTCGNECEFLIAGDIRLDNRAQLCHRYELEYEGVPDSQLFATLFQRIGKKIFAQIVGRYTLAIWNSNSKVLLLARSPYGSSCLYWRRDKLNIGFSSVAKILGVLTNQTLLVSPQRVAHILTSQQYNGVESQFVGVKDVRRGTYVEIGEADERETEFYSVRNITTVRYKTNHDYIDAFGEVLSSAMRSAIDTDGGVASTLSSGYDSAAVSIAAAEILQKKHMDLICYTGVPMKSDVKTFEGRHADESAGASAVASKHSNIDHRLVQSRGMLSIGEIDQMVQEMEWMPYASNTFFRDMLTGAKEDKVKVILSGASGNYTISYGGEAYPAETMNNRQHLKWLKAVLYLKQKYPSRKLPTILFQSMEDQLPPWLVVKLKAWKNRDYHNLDQYSLISSDLLHAHTEGLSKQIANANYQQKSFSRKNSVQQRFDCVFYRTASENYYLAEHMHGVEFRDPTQDQRLIEFCLGLPLEKYFYSEKKKWLVESYFAGKLPAEITNAKTRGLQSADWYLAFDARLDEIIARFELMHESDVRNYIDTGKALKLLHNWGNVDHGSYECFYTYHLNVLKALSVGSFLLHYEGKC